MAHPESGNDKPASQRSSLKEGQQHGATGFGLTGKILLLMLVVSLVPLLLYGGISYKASRDRILAGQEFLMSQTAEGLMGKVDEWLDKNLRVLQAAARLPGAVSMQADQQEPVLKAVDGTYPWMYLVFTVGPDGKNVARSDGKALKDYSDRQYYKDVVHLGREFAWQSLIGKTSKKPALVLSVPIRKGDEVVGVLAAAMNIDDISKAIATWKKGETGHVFLVDEKGRVVAHPEDTYVQSQTDFSTHPLVRRFSEEHQAATAHFTDLKGQPTLGHVRGNAFGWALVVQQEDQEVFAELNSVRMFALGLSGVTFVIVVLIAWSCARAIVRPIKELTGVAERMSLGDLDMAVQVNSRDEIGLLAEAIERMQTSLRVAMDRLRRRAY